MFIFDKLHGALGEVLFFVAIACPIAMAFYLFVRQEYTGKNRVRIDRIRTEFGEKYELSFLFGTLRLRPHAGQEPNEDDGFTIGKIYWSDSGKFRENIITPGFVMMDSSGKHRFVFMPGQADGHNCIVSLKISKGLLWAKREMSRAVELDT